MSWFLALNCTFKKLFSNLQLCCLHSMGTTLTWSRWEVVWCRNSHSPFTGAPTTLEICSSWRSASHFCPVFETRVIPRISSYSWNKKQQCFSNTKSRVIMVTQCDITPYPRYYRGLHPHYHGYRGIPAIPVTMQSSDTHTHTHTFSRWTQLSRLSPQLHWQAGGVAIRYFSLYPTHCYQLSWLRGFDAKFLQAGCSSSLPSSEGGASSLLH